MDFCSVNQLFDTTRKMAPMWICLLIVLTTQSMTVTIP